MRDNLTETYVRSVLTRDVPGTTSDDIRTFLEDDATSQ